MVLKFSMLSRPVFRSCFDVQVADDRHVLVFGEDDHFVITGTLYAWLTPLLRDRLPLNEILDRANGHGKLEVLYALELLARRGLVRDAAESGDESAERFWDSLGVDPTAVSRSIATSAVNVAAVGGPSPHALTKLLLDSGVAAGREPALHVVLTDDYLRPELAAINELRLADGVPWLLARPFGTFLWLGPLLRRDGACWECMAKRMRERRLAGRFLQKRRGDSYPRLVAGGVLPATESAAVALVATEVLKCLAGVEPRLDGSLVTIDLATMTSERHAVMRRSRCRVCGTRSPLVAAQVTPGNRQPLNRFYRLESAERTAERLAPLVSRYTGVIGELTPMDDTDNTLAPLYRSGPNPSTVDDSAEMFRAVFRTACGGKGTTDALAKASALGEAIERYSGIFEGDEPRIRSSYVSLGEEAIHPNASMLYSDAQYAGRDAADRLRSTRVPHRFDEDDEEVEWSPVWSVTNQRFRYLPTALCYYDYVLDDAKRFCFADSNGCSAGATVEEAIVHGFFELVERDSVALWWLNRLRRPAVDLDSFDNSYTDALRNYYRSLGRTLWVLDLTSDLGVPAVAAVSARHDTPAQDVIVGFGAHFDAEIAVTRALTEMNQFLPVVMPRHLQADAAFRSTDEGVLAWLRTATTENQPFLAPAVVPPVHRDTFRRFEHQDLTEAVEECVAVAKRCGLELLVLDQTRDGIDLSVVRVVVPGLRHFWRRLAPGRLYDVPAMMGWSDTPLTEDTVNPIAVCF